MNDGDTTKRQNSLSSLQLARDLVLPSREEMLRRDPSVQGFWKKNKDLLSDAWIEWEKSKGESLFCPDSSLLDLKLRSSVEKAWEDPTCESIVRDHWVEVSSGVFQCQFFDPERLLDLRKYLDQVADANIPMRPPYGIALNRRGAMLDPRSEGFLAAPSFQMFYRELLNRYMRPIARLLFPEVVGYDLQTFGFSIQYQAGMDTSLQPHTDASAATLNINLNLPGEVFTGSGVDFFDHDTGKVNRMSFEPGTAMIHRGNVAHAAQPITSGERFNFVLWLYGDHGQIPLRGSKPKEIDAHERWTVPSVEYDDAAPF